MRMHNPPHPGSLLREGWLDELGISITRFAEMPGVSRKTVSEIVNCRAAVTPEMAWRPELALGKNAGSWLSMQAHYDLWQLEQRGDDSGIKRIVTVMTQDPAAPATNNPHAS